MLRTTCLLAICLVPLAGLGAQNTVYVPDNVSSSGLCNSIPFGPGIYAAGYTYMARVPATALAGALPRLQQIFFAPCSSGTWSCATVRVTVGHVPNPLPVQFTFPTATALGSFLDQTTLFDSALQGPLTWAPVQDTWSPFLPAGGTTFCWNGVNDIALYLTFQNATVNFGGYCYRTTTEPFRMYAPGYQAITSQFSNVAGLKMQLDFAVCGPALWETNSPASSLDIGGVTATTLQPALSSVPFSAPVLVNVASTNLALPYDIAYALAPSVALNAGGISSAFGQIVNINLAAPQFAFLFGLTLTTPFPGPFAIAFAAPSIPITLSMQMLNLDPTSLDGFSLSQCSQLNVP